MCLAGHVGRAIELECLGGALVADAGSRPASPPRLGPSTSARHRRTRESAPPRPRRTHRCHLAGCIESTDRFPAHDRSRGRCVPGRPPPTGRTARQSPAADGWAASPHPSRFGSAPSRQQTSRSAPEGSSPRPPACCGARRPSSGGNRAHRQLEPVIATQPAPRLFAGHCGPARGRAPRGLGGRLAWQSHPSQQCTPRAIPRPCFHDFGSQVIRHTVH